MHLIKIEIKHGADNRTAFLLETKGQKTLIVKNNDGVFLNSEVSLQKVEQLPFKAPARPRKLLYIEKDCKEVEGSELSNIAFFSGKGTIPLTDNLQQILA